LLQRHERLNLRQFPRYGKSGKARPFSANLSRINGNATGLYCNGSPQLFQMNVRTEKYILFLILLFGFILRALSINYGLPNPGYFSSDEIDSISRAVKIGAGDLTPAHFNKPTFYNIIIIVFNLFAFLFYRIIGADTDFKRLFIQNPAFFYIPARLASVCAGTAALYLCYRAGKKLKDARVGLSAAFLLSCCYTTVRFSHYAKEDALLTLMVLLTFMIAIKLGEGISAKRVLITGLLTGLTAAAKFTGILAIIFPVYYLIKNKNLKPKILLSLLGGVLFGFALGMPYFIIHPISFFKGLISSTILRQVQGGTIWLGGEKHFGLIFIAKMFIQEFGCLYAAALLYFLFHAIFNKGKISAKPLFKTPSAFFALIFLTIIIFAGHLDYHYIMPLTPFLCLAAAVNIAKAKSNTIYVMMMFLLIVEPLYRSVKFDVESFGEDTRITAAKWIEANIPTHEQIAFDTAYFYQYHPPIGLSKESLDALKLDAQKEGGTGNYYQLLGEYQNKEKIYYARFLPMPTWLEKLQPSNIEQYNLGNLQKGGFTWLVCSSYYHNRIMNDKNYGWQPIRNFYLEIFGKELQIFQPQPWVNMGPIIKVYRIGESGHQR